MPKLIQEVRLPITHNKGDSRSEWVVQVAKRGNSYAVSTNEYAFCYLDDEIIKRIFEPLKTDLSRFFYQLGDAKSLTANAEMYLGGGVHFVVSGIKRQGMAIGIANFLVEIVSRVLDVATTEQLDRSLLMSDTKEPEIYNVIKLFNDDLTPTEIKQ